MHPRLLVFLACASLCLAFGVSVTLAQCSGLCPTNVDTIPQVTPQTCQPLSQVGWLVAGQNYWIGKYRLVIQPGNGGVFVSIESVMFFSNCSAYTSKVSLAVSWDGANAQIGTSSGNYQFNLDGAASLVPYQYGWGSLCTAANCATIDWDSTASGAFKPRVWIPSASPCSRFLVLMHFTGCPTKSCGLNGCQTTISRGPGNNQVVGAWFTQTSFSDCAACTNTLQCPKAQPPSCTPGSAQSAACPYVADVSRCNSPPQSMTCPKAVCDQLTYQCSYTDQGAAGCPGQGPTPVIFCARCNGNACVAQLGYDASKATAVDASGTLSYQIGDADKITSPAVPGKIDWGQPQVFIAGATVTAAATIDYQPSQLPLTWTLDGKTAVVNASTPQCLTYCDSDPGTITADAQYVNGQLTIVYSVNSTTNTGCVQNDANFLLDIGDCAIASYSVADSCLDSSRLAGVVTSTAALATDAQLTANADCILNKLVRPLVVPIKTTCANYALTVVFNSGCTLGRTNVGVLKTTSGCQGCDQCRVTDLAGPNNPCLVPPVCNPVTQVFDRVNCKCTNCPTPTCDGVNQEASGCTCVPCVRDPCPPNSRRRFPCDTCQPCPDPGCTVGQRLRVSNTNDVCNDCQPCTVVTCTGNQVWADDSHCSCKSCPACPDNQVPDNTDSTCGCKPCPAPTPCPPNTTFIPARDPCNCVPCTQTCLASQNQRGNKNLCSPCDTCPVPSCGTNSKPNATSNCYPCVPCPDPNCASPFRYNSSCANGPFCCPCVPCTPPASCPANSSKPSDPCLPCQPCSDCKTKPNLRYNDPSDICKGCYDCTKTCSASNSQKPDPSDPCNCLNCTNALCVCEGAATQPSDCTGGDIYNWTSCSCVPPPPCDCPAGQKPNSAGCACPFSDGCCINCTNANCVCENAAQQAANCDSKNQNYNWTTCQCDDCIPSECPVGSERPASAGNCSTCVPCDPLATVCPVGWEVNPLNACNCTQCPACETEGWVYINASNPCLGCKPCPTPTCPSGSWVDETVSKCNCTTCPTPQCGPCEYVDDSTLPCPTCKVCQPNCTYPFAVDPNDCCSCVRCTPTECGAGTTRDPNDECGCVSCVIECTSGQTKVQPPSSNPLCDPCEDCPRDCPDGQVLIDRNDPCKGCQFCPDPQCVEPQVYTANGCGCTDCIQVTECPTGERPTASGCSCEPCTDTVCTPPQIVDSENVCGCVSPPPPPPPPPQCPYYDACGLCRGRNRTCIGCDGTVGSRRFIDACGVTCGDGSSCPGCTGDLCAVCTKPVDLCGVCGGNSSTCDGCDGVPASGAIYDWCGVCDGNGTSCLGCDGLPNTSACAPIPPAAIAAVTSLTALAALSCLALAAILWRMRHKPEMLFQAWDQEIDEYIAQLEQNPIFQEQVSNTNALFDH